MPYFPLFLYSSPISPHFCKGHSPLPMTPTTTFKNFPICVHFPPLFRILPHFWTVFSSTPGSRKTFSLQLHKDYTHLQKALATVAIVLVPLARPVPGLGKIQEVQLRCFYDVRLCNKREAEASVLLRRNRPLKLPCVLHGA